MRGGHFFVWPSPITTASYFNFNLSKYSHKIGHNIQSQPSQFVPKKHRNLKSIHSKPFTTIGKGFYYLASFLALVRFSHLSEIWKTDNCQKLALNRGNPLKTHCMWYIFDNANISLARISIVKMVGCAMFSLHER